jgi:inorganic pyrophosphatase
MAFGNSAEKSLPFFKAIEELVKTSEVVIDRPKGTPHPRYPEDIYPLDYGYLKGTSSGDGDGIDIWVGSLGAQQVSAIVVTVDLVKRDSEIKILLGCSVEECQVVLDRHNQGSQSASLLRPNL